MAKQQKQQETPVVAKKAAKAPDYLVPLHYPFHLPGKTLAREIPFMGGLELTERWKRELEDGDGKPRRDYYVARKNRQKVMQTLLQLVKGSISAEKAARSLAKADSRGQSWRIIPKKIETKLKEEPAVRGLLETLLQFGELRFANLGRHLAAVEHALDCITKLGGAALDHGDVFAAEQLVELATYAVTILEALSEKRPELLRPFARKSSQWPVMAGIEPGWQARTQDKLQTKLELGEGTLHGRLDKSKAYQLENVSRRYARGIVETLEKNRCCMLLARERCEIIRRKMKKDSIQVMVPRVPDWVLEAAKLRPFGVETADAWLGVGMKMLKEQRRHLPGSPDWARITTHWGKRGERQTPGRIWNSIRDALRSPIKTIARASTKMVTQIRGPK